MLAHYYAELDSTPSPPSANWLRRTMGGVMEGILYISSTDGSLYVRYLYFYGSRWISNYNWLDNGWDSSYPAVVCAILLFFSHR